MINASVKLEEEELEPEPKKVTISVVGCARNYKEELRRQMDLNWDGDDDSKEVL